MRPTIEEAKRYIWEELMGHDATQRYARKYLAYIFEGMPRPAYRRADGRLRVSVDTLVKVHKAISGQADDLEALLAKAEPCEPPSRTETRIAAQLARLETRVAALEAARGAR